MGNVLRETGHCAGCLRESFKSLQSSVVIKVIRREVHRDMALGWRYIGRGKETFRNYLVLLHKYAFSFLLLLLDIVWKLIYWNGLAARH